MQLFGPNTSEFSAKDSDPVSRNVTVPLAVEIVKPAAQLLEQILPVGQTPTPASSAPSGNTFIDAMRNKSNQVRTANGAEAFKSTTSAVLDAFSSLNENSPAQAFHRMLAASWNESPKLTLRIIWNIRSIPEGQNDKPGFYRAFGWLYKNHPRTALENLRCVTEKLCQRKIDHKPTRIGDDGFVLPDTDDETTEQIIKVPHGYFKDLLNIVVLAMHDQLGDPKLEEFTSLKTPPMERKDRRSQKEWKAAMEAKKEENARLTVDEAKRIRKARAEEAASIRAKEAKETRSKRHGDNFALLAHKLAHDRPFRALYSLVAQTFAEELAKDLAILNQIESASEADVLNLELELSSAGKWAPALDGFYDRATNISTAVAVVLHARGHMSDLNMALSPEVTQKQAVVLRSYYRRWVLCPLRRFLDVPEIKMSAGNWSKIDYERISDKCMQKNQHLFMKYDEERFTKFLRDVTTGKRKIRHESLLPHRILMSALGVDEGSGVVLPRTATKKSVDDLKQETRQKIAAALWNSLVEQMRSSGSLENALAIVDVSGSMGTLDGGRSMMLHSGSKRVAPIFPAVALGILLATIAKPPFNNMFITFSAKPEFVTLPAGNLVHQAQHMSRSDWTVNTDYEAVFMKLILPTAVENNVKPEDMPKRLFVFSDMQFDQSLTENIRTGWETTHDRVTKAFLAAGYEVPEIVYWNLDGGCSTQPVLKDTPGTAMVTGFAANMMRLFMMGKVTDQTSVLPDREPRDVPRVSHSGPMTPMEIMQRALSKPCYDPLQVYD